MADQKKSTLNKMEPPFSGHYYMHEDKGVYECKACGTTLFSSESKIHTGSGWASFDDTFNDTITMKKGDSKRGQEVYCANCNQFLGLFIEGESFTNKNQRFDVNSTALRFNPDYA